MIRLHSNGGPAGKNSNFGDCAFQTEIEAIILSLGIDELWLEIALEFRIRKFEKTIDITLFSDFSLIFSFAGFNSRFGHASTCQ